MNTNTTPSYPPAIVARVTAEFEQLSIRLQKLESFLNGPNVASLEAADVHLLKEQRAVMTLYFDVLARRLARMAPGTMKLAEPPRSSASVFSAQGGVVTPPEGTLFGFAPYADPNLSGTQHAPIGVVRAGETRVFEPIRSGEGGVFGGAGAGGDFGGGSGSSDSSSSSSDSSSSSSSSGSSD